MKHGILTLVDCYPDTLSDSDGSDSNGADNHRSGHKMTLGERYAQIIEVAVVADQLGFDFMWVGEHHGSAFYCSPSPVPLLSAIAARTTRIRIGPGVCQLAHHDPVLVAEEYAMLDVLSNGRLDMLFGRPTFMRGFHLLNQRISESAPRTLEGVKVVRNLWSQAAVTHEGQFYSLKQSVLHPKPLQPSSPPTYIAVGTPSAARSVAKDALNLSVLSVFGRPRVFRETVQEYCAGLAEAGLNPANHVVAAGRHTFVHATDEEAQLAFGIYYERYLRHLREELAYSPPESLGIERPPEFQISQLAKGLYADIPIQQRIDEQTACGSPETVARKVIELHDMLGKLDAYWSIFDVGGCPTAEIIQSMQLYASEVRPRVERALG